MLMQARGEERDYMVLLGMKGPYKLTSDSIDEEVTETGPGNYGLGYARDDDTFIVKYVGRSDTDLNGRLHDWIGKYKSFKYSSATATSPKAVFEKECRNYHDFGGSKGLDNSSHPDRPAGSGWKCPVCHIFG